MSSETADVSEMIAVHDALRREYGSLPLLVKSVPDGDRDRAGVVADHIGLLGTFMALHHAGEDDLLWPLVSERAPDSPVLVLAEADHAELAEQGRLAGELTEAWRNDPSATNRAALHVELIALERAVLQHLGHEEAEVLPLLAATVTPTEYAALGAYVRAGLTPDQWDVVVLLGLNASSVAEATAERAYRDRLLDS
jgi:Hemerythrin HHE cation binding domain